MKTIEEIQAVLNEPLDMSLTEQRKGAGGMKLDYMSTFGTKDGMNKVFGNGCWGYEPKTLDELEDCRESVEKRAQSGETYSLHTRAYRSVVKVYASFLDSGNVVTVFCSDVGFGDCSDRSMLKAHETAGKEAVTDGVKRAANGFGNRLGLALYDKSRENVTNGAPKVKAAPAKATASKKPAATKKDTEALDKIVAEMKACKDLESLEKQKEVARGYCQKHPEATQLLQQTFQQVKKGL